MKVKKFVYASSGCAIYGSYGEMPLKEDFISLWLKLRRKKLKFLKSLLNRRLFFYIYLQ